MVSYSSNLDLIIVNVYTKFGQNLSFHSQENEIQTSIKGRNSVTYWQIMMIINPNLDLFNVNVYTKFGKDSVH